MGSIDHGLCTEAGRNWGTAQPSLFPFPFPVPSSGLPRVAERWGTLGSQMLLHGLEWCHRCDQRTTESRMVGWTLNPSSSSLCHGQGHFAQASLALLQVVTPSIPQLLLLKKAMSCISLLHPFYVRPVLGGGTSCQQLQMGTATPSTSLCPALRCATALAHSFRDKLLFRQDMAEIKFLTF